MVDLIVPPTGYPPEAIWSYKRRHLTYVKKLLVDDPTEYSAGAYPHEEVLVHSYPITTLDPNIMLNIIMLHLTFDAYKSGQVGYLRLYMGSADYVMQVGVPYESWHSYDVYVTNMNVFLLSDDDGNSNINADLKWYDTSSNTTASVYVRNMKIVAWGVYWDHE